jgi:hypothetical protein
MPLNVWKNGEKIIPNWFHLIERVCLKLHPIWYVILESLGELSWAIYFPLNLSPKDLT